MALTTIMSCDSTSPENLADNANSSNSNLFVRGAFNGWSTENPLDTDGEKLRTRVSVGMGIHSFKVANKDWSKQWLIKSGQVIDLESDHEFPLELEAKMVDYNSQILAAKPAMFDIVVNMAKTPAELIIENVSFTRPDMTAPHDEDSHVTLEFTNIDGNVEHVGFSVQSELDGRRTYVQSTTQLLRDPVPQYSIYQEHAELPVTRTGNLAFDALFALSMDEMKLNSVEKIKDSNYNLGQAIDCSCFETGEKWNYVWTRDLAYAAHLGLGFFDPQRTVNSLNFKTSELRLGTKQQATKADLPLGLHIVQDTGSGGSWPISTDRVSWAFGAQSVLSNLTGSTRKAFIEDTFAALSNTLEVDRNAVFNSEFGLYQGEQSFLDWREQSYAKWIVDDLSSMATSMSLSTNVGHYQALTLAASLAQELEQQPLATKYQQWADRLKQAINDKLWLPKQGLYSSLTSAHPYPVVMEKYDWLGLSLAIITGVASEQQTQEILKNYPHSEMGPPVIFPQQPDIQIYHNRAIWPFVTAFGLQAAKVGNNVEVAEHAINSLIRGAALNLSNMENLEWQSGQSIWLDKSQPGLSGPAINSKRQLWSVAGYINMVVDTLFGVTSEEQQLIIDPYIPVNVVNTYFNGTEALQLNNISWQGKLLDFKYHLPEGLNGAQNSDKRLSQVLKVQGIGLNGHSMPLSPNEKVYLPLTKLNNKNQIDVYLTVNHAKRGITKVGGPPVSQDPTHFAPTEPSIIVAIEPAQHRVHFTSPNHEQNLVFDVFRNGQLVAQGLAKNVWFDKSEARHNACYSVQATYINTGNVSHHSPTKCTAPLRDLKVENDQVAGVFVETNLSVTDSKFGKMLANWGAKDDHLSFSWSQPEKEKAALQLKYRNTHQSVNTGITASVKQFVIKNAKTGEVIAKQVIQMPHTKPDSGVALSSPLLVELPSGELTISVFDYMNMSYLQSNVEYSSEGGHTGYVNTSDLYGLSITPISK